MANHLRTEKARENFKQTIYEWQIVDGKKRLMPVLYPYRNIPVPPKQYAKVKSMYK